MNGASRSLVLRAGFAAPAVPADFALPHFRLLECRQQRTDSRVYLDVQLDASAYRDVFFALADDIMRHIGPIREEGRAAAAFIGRLVRWQRFLERARQDGLSPEEQRGLFGELVFLHQHALATVPPAEAAGAWTGPVQSAKDFQFANGCAAEVKTTASRHAETVEISSERQLDESEYGVLLLFHLAVEPVRGAGTTLPVQVAHVKQALSADAVASALFEDKLLDAGYFDAHQPRYADVGYLQHGQAFYHVRDAFPRLIPANLPAGVNDTRYKISITGCEAYRLSEQDARRQIGTPE